jgi:hypothetical protein
VVVGGDVIGRVGHRGQPVGVVEGLSCDLAVLVRHRRPPPTRIVSKADRTAVRIFGIEPLLQARI